MSNPESIKLNEFMGSASSFIHDLSSPLASIQLKSGVLSSKLLVLKQIVESDPTAAKQIIDLLIELPDAISSDVQKIQSRTLEFSVSIGNTQAPDTNSREISDDEIPALKILVIEDEEIHQLIALKLLEGKHHVDTAGSGTEAINAVQSADYDVVLLDYFMPDITGSKLVEQLQDVSKCSPLIFALTNYSTTAFEDEIAPESVHGYLSKPLKLQDFNKAFIRANKSSL